MNMDRPQEPYDERDHPERVEDERDGATAQERDHPERVEDERDGAAAQELDHPEHVEDGRDGAAAQEAERPTATATALPEDKGAAPESTAGEQLTVLDAERAPPRQGGRPRYTVTSRSLVPASWRATARAGSPSSSASWTTQRARPSRPTPSSANCSGGSPSVARR